MELPGMTYRGAALDDVEVLERLPVDYAQLLAQRNGFVALGGALHVRGACREPAWHSVRAAWEGPAALFRLFSALRPDDVPFAQESTGDQFVLRGGAVHRLRAAENRVEELGLDLSGFMDAALRDPLEVLGLDLLSDYRREGTTLRPGQLLTREHPPRALPAEELLAALAGLKPA